MKPIFAPIITLLIILVVSCDRSPAPNSSSAETKSTQTPEASLPETPVISLEDVPPLDRSKHSVPLEEIYFDTFRRTNRVVSLSDASDDLILSLQDVIPPFYAPKFTSASESQFWMNDSDIVIGYADGGEAYAYPIKIMNWHEIVSHEVNGRPILATY